MYTPRTYVDSVVYIVLFRRILITGGEGGEAKKYPIWRRYQLRAYIGREDDARPEKKTRSTKTRRTAPPQKRVSLCDILCDIVTAYLILLLRRRVGPPKRRYHLFLSRVRCYQGPVYNNINFKRTHTHTQTPYIGHDNIPRRLAAFPTRRSVGQNLGHRYVRARFCGPSRQRHDALAPVGPSTS